MKLKLIVTTGAVMLASACASDSSSPGDEVSTAGSGGLGAVGSVVELRDAAVTAGYTCADWRQTNAVGLAAESATCDDSSVLSTYASEADLQAQLDLEKSMRDVLADSGIPGTPVLVGDNWLFKDPSAADLVEELGGTLISPKS